MAITTLAGLQSARRENLNFIKTNTRSGTAQGYFSVIDNSGNPSAGALAAGNNTSGIVPVSANNGYPTIPAFGAGQSGYLAGVEGVDTVVGRQRLIIFDRLFVAGTFAFNATAAALSSQPSFAGRVPSGVDFAGLEIWVETTVSTTGNQTWNISYTNEAGTGGRTTGAIGVGAVPSIGRCWQLPLQSGDSGVQRIDAVTGGTATAGGANVMVLRRLGHLMMRQSRQPAALNLFELGLPEIYSDSALYVLVQQEASAGPLPDLLYDIAVG